jgi:antitoxin (DNA-binding transcriptional repressor) of toxin-antitoxin stability system
MTSVSVAEARRSIAELIRRAESGERVAITRRGRVVAEVGPPAVDDVPRAVELQWIDEHRIKLDPSVLSEPDGVHWVQRMRERDEL